MLSISLTQKVSLFQAFGQTTEFVGPGSRQEEEEMNEAVAIRASGQGSWMPNVRPAPCASATVLPLGRLALPVPIAFGGPSDFRSF